MSTMTRVVIWIIMIAAAAAIADTNFLDLYTCKDQWETINGRNGYRILDCNASSVKNSESCTGTNFICIGKVSCTPIPGAKFPEGLDPDWINFPIEYMAGCHALNANDCKSPVECMKESMEKQILKGDIHVSRQERYLRGRGSR